MKHKLLLTILFGIFTMYSAKSQTADTDSVFVELDSTFVNITDVLENSSQGKIKINQSSDVTEALSLHSIENFKNQKITGYRICIFRDNQQNSRSVALQTKQNFKSVYPDIPTYWEYKNPYFYVYVGDFRTKGQAEKFKRKINAMYPKSWLVNETKINLPSL
ncbi:MAG: SPOR domain-containing protein [Prevotellaceae bacterium]|nr:SPOR domain-containing protein [Prevotellaceae bacterium]